MAASDDDAAAALSICDALPGSAMGGMPMLAMDDSGGTVTPGAPPFRDGRWQSASVAKPWRCLWRALALQITYSLRPRLTILQLAHTFLRAVRMRILLANA